MSYSPQTSAFDPHETKWADDLAGQPLAPFGRRAGAFALDLVLALFTFTPLILLRHRLWPAADQGRVVIAFRLHDVWSLAWIVVYFGTTTWLWDGPTIGKRLFKLRVASLVGPQITLWQASERALGYGASTLEAGFGFAQFFLARNRQCVHDRIAGTIVILDKRRF